MSVETQEIEYKDFSKGTAPDKKAILSKLFKEITAFANASGGTIVIGKEDETGIENPQPTEVLHWLENDCLTRDINKISDNLVVFQSNQNDGIVTISIQESQDVISAAVDYKNIHKGDCFIRENHECVVAKGNALTRLIERKTISTDARLQDLRKIVHYKFSKGQNSASSMNIFDSLVVSLDSDNEYINTTFDAFVRNQFIGGYQLPLSKHSTMQMHLDTMAAIVQGTSTNPVVALRSAAFTKLTTGEHFNESFYKAHRESALASPELRNYLFESRSIIGK